MSNYTGRKYEAIDIVKLFNDFNEHDWNSWLTECLNTKAESDLLKVYYGLQAGMTDAAKKKLNSDKINNTFLRWQKSIEITMKKLYRKKYPNALDNPLVASKMPKELFQAALKAKRDRDESLELLFKKVRF